MRQLRLISGICLCCLLSFLGNGAMGGTHGRCETGEACLVAELLSPETVHVGDSVDIILKYSLPEGASLVKPVTVHGVDDLRVVSLKQRDGRILVKCLVESTGQWGTGELAIDWLDRDGIRQRLSAPALSMPVRSNFAKNNQPELQDIQDIMPTVPLWRRLMPWMVAAGLLLFALSAVFYIFNRLKQRRNRVNYAHPAHEALRAIQELKARRFVEAGNIKQFYFGLSEIIRKYIERIRGIAASEMTSDELSVHLSDSRDRAMLPVFREMDQVKFANAMPSDNAIKKLEIEILDYISETSPEQEKSDGGTVR